MVVTLHRTRRRALPRSERRQRLSPWVELVEVTVGEAASARAFHGLGVADYASALAFRPDGCVLVVRQYRPMVDATPFELPSGMIDPGEAPAVTACRETFEETGYRVVAHHALAPLFVDGGRLQNRAHAVVAVVEATPSGPGERDVEVHALAWASFAALVARGGLAQSNHGAVLALAMLDPAVAPFLRRHGLDAPWPAASPCPATGSDEVL